MVARTLSRTRPKSAAAYSLVDLSNLHPETRKDIIEDAYAGGGTYGIRVVEESVNGGARAPIFGVYKDGPDAERWASAKKELKLDSKEIDDADVQGIGDGVIINDPRREAALREAAAQRGAGEADSIRAGEAAAVASITGDEDDDGVSITPNPSADRTGATDGHATNIVDTTLAADATNEASTAENQKPTKKSNKAPK